MHRQVGPLRFGPDGLARRGALVRHLVMPGQADESAAKLIGTGEPLARALEKLDAFAGRVPADVDPNQASAYIINPLKAQAAGGGMGKMFSTHPPTEERIARLRAM